MATILAHLVLSPNMKLSVLRWKKPPLRRLKKAGLLAMDISTKSPTGTGLATWDMHQLWKYRISWRIRRGPVSGYTVSNFTYTLLSSNPTKLEQVSMDVAATAGADAPSDVRITVDGGSTWVTCSGPSGTTWTCTFSIGNEPSVSSLSNLQVVATQ